MTIRNGFREYALAGLLFGAPMGLLFGILYTNALLGVIDGVLCAVLFSLFLFLFAAATERRFRSMRAKIEQQRRILCDGPATVGGNGGWLYLTEAGLEFYPHKLNFSRQRLFIPLASIRTCDIKCTLRLSTDDGTVHTLQVAKPKVWGEQITAVAQTAQANEV